MAQPAICNKGRQVRDYPLDGAATFVEGAAVLLSGGEVEECGADPAAILGFALHDAGALPNETRVLVALATAEATFWLQGTANPALTDIGAKYGIAKHADGEWVLDKAEAVNTRLSVEDVDLTRNLYEVRVLAANRQLV